MVDERVNPVLEIDCRDLEGEMMGSSNPGKGGGRPLGVHWSLTGAGQETKGNY